MSGADERASEKATARPCRVIVKEKETGLFDYCTTHGKDYMNCLAWDLTAAMDVITQHNLTIASLKNERDGLKDKNLELYSILHDYWKIHNHANAYAHERSASQECSLGSLCARIKAAMKGGGK